MQFEKIINWKGLSTSVNNLLSSSTHCQAVTAKAKINIWIYKTEKNRMQILVWATDYKKNLFF